MASKRKYTKKSEYWNKFSKANSIEETLANNPLLQNSTYSPTIEGEPFIGSTAKASCKLRFRGPNMCPIGSSTSVKLGHLFGPTKGIVQSSRLPQRGLHIGFQQRVNPIELMN